MHLLSHVIANLSGQTLDQLLLVFALITCDHAFSHLYSFWMCRSSFNPALILVVAIMESYCKRTEKLRGRLIVSLSAYCVWWNMYPSIINHALLVGVWARVSWISELHFNYSILLVIIGRWKIMFFVCGKSSLGSLVCCFLYKKNLGSVIFMLIDTNIYDESKPRKLDNFSKQQSVQLE